MHDDQERRPAAKMSTIPALVVQLSDPVNFAAHACQICLTCVGAGCRHPLV